MFRQILRENFAAGDGMVRFLSDFGAAGYYPVTGMKIRITITSLIKEPSLAAPDCSNPDPDLIHNQPP
jgi:hypothetical protein